MWIVRRSGHAPLTFQLSALPRRRAALASRARFEREGGRWSLKGADRIIEREVADRTKQPTPRCRLGRTTMPSTVSKFGTCRRRYLLFQLRTHARPKPQLKNF